MKYIGDPNEVNHAYEKLGESGKKSMKDFIKKHTSECLVVLIGGLLLTGLYFAKKPNDKPISIVLSYPRSVDMIDTKGNKQTIDVSSMFQYFYNNKMMGVEVKKNGKLLTNWNFNFNPLKVK